MSEQFFINKPISTNDIVQDAHLAASFAVYRASNGEQLKWSASFPLPAIGDRVRITMNDIGWGIVKGYFSSHYYVGVMVLPEHPPEWLVSQNKRDANAPAWRKQNIACIFGAELSLT